MISFDFSAKFLVSNTVCGNDPGLNGQCARLNFVAVRCSFVFLLEFIFICLLQISTNALRVLPSVL